MCDRVVMVSYVVGGCVRRKECEVAREIVGGGE